MGAVAALRFAANSQCNILCLVLDSSYAILTELMNDIANSYKIIPILFSRWAVHQVRNHIFEVANFDINHMNSLVPAVQSKYPAIFVHGD